MNGNIFKLLKKSFLLKNHVIPTEQCVLTMLFQTLVSLQKLLFPPYTMQSELFCENLLWFNIVWGGDKNIKQDSSCDI